MKKVFAILAVAGLLTACGNDSSSSNEKNDDAEKEVAADKDTSSNMMDNPSHNMAPPDSGGTERRPRD